MQAALARLQLWWAAKANEVDMRKDNLTHLHSQFWMLLAHG
jgi:hypothetical protein